MALLAQPLAQAYWPALSLPRPTRPVSSSPTLKAFSRVMPKPAASFFFSLHEKRMTACSFTSALLQLHPSSYERPAVSFSHLHLELHSSATLRLHASRHATATYQDGMAVCPADAPAFFLLHHSPHTSSERTSPTSLHFWTTPAPQDGSISLLDTPPCLHFTSITLHQGHQSTSGLSQLAPFFLP